MTWLEERLKHISYPSTYYRLVVNDPDYQLSKTGKAGLFTGVGIILECIDDWCEDEDEADEIYDELTQIFNILERELANPPSNKIPKEAKFAYKEDTYNKYFDYFDELDDIIRSLDMGFSIEIEEVQPNEIIWEDKDQIAYI